MYVILYKKFAISKIAFLIIWFLPLTLYSQVNGFEKYGISSAQAREKVNNNLFSYHTISRKNSFSGDIDKIKIETTCSWKSFSPKKFENAQHSVTCGDINFDGYKDIISSDNDGNIFLYINQKGNFNDKYDNKHSFRDIIGDVNFAKLGGSSKPDLFLTERRSRAIILFDIDKNFSYSRSWRSYYGGGMGSVQFADIDNDGDLDISYCGHIYDGSCAKIYYNKNGNFSKKADWSYGKKSYAYAICYTDLDNDKYKELILSADSLYIFKNNQGTIDSSYAWKSDTKGLIYSIATADFDHNGLQDFATAGENRIYLNFSNRDNFSFKLSNWNQKGTKSSYGVAAADLDNDGDSDLIFANFGKNEIYENQNGVFKEEPAWISKEDYLSTDIEIVDIDNDGDLDVLFGNTMGMETNPQDAGITLYKNYLGDIYAPPPPMDFRVKDAGYGSFLIAWVDSNADDISGHKIFYKDMMDSLFEGKEANEGNSPITVYSKNNFLISGLQMWKYYDFKISSFDKANNESKPTNAIKTISKSAKLQFKDIGSILGDRVNAGNAAFADIDNDGDLDLYISRLRKNYGASSFLPAPNRLYRNDSNGSNIIFTNITQDAGVGDAGYGASILFGDINNDGYADLFISNWDSPNSLYLNVTKNDTIKFSDISLSSGIRDRINSKDRGAVMGDFDNDGDLDIFICSEGKNQLYRNDSNCKDSIKFTNISNECGFSIDNSSTGAVAGDFDMDGDLDIFVCNYRQQNRFYENISSNRLIKFREVAEKIGLRDLGPYGLGMASWAADAGDFDNDGDLDLYITNDTGAYQSDATNLLYRNDSSPGHLKFTNVTKHTNTGGIGPANDPSGIRSSDGLTFGDFDNDGFLDIYICTYSCISHSNMLLYNFSKNLSYEYFSDISPYINIDSPIQSNSAIVGDIDNDGDLDIFVSNGINKPWLLQNRKNDNNYIKVKLIGTESNKSAIGTKLWLYNANHFSINSLIGYREIKCGSGFFSLNSQICHFGVDENNYYDLKITFPSKKTLFLENILAPQFLKIKEPNSKPPVLSGIPDITFANNDTFSLFLNKYVHDPDTPICSLKWKIWVSNDSLSFSVDTLDNVINFYADNFIGKINAIIYVSDETNLWDSDTISVDITASHSGITKKEMLPLKYCLYPNFPNPFNPFTTIEYDIPKITKIRVRIFNVLGNHIRTLVNRRQAPGHYSLTWDGQDKQHHNVPSGIYICQLKAGKFVTSRKMLLVR